MKKKHLSRIQFIFIWLGIYLFVLFFGVALSTGVTYFRNQNMKYIAQTDMEYYIENDRFNASVMINHSNNFVYDSAGTRVASLTTPDMLQYFDFDRYAAKLLPRVQQGETVYTMTFQPHLENHIAIVVAIPMENGGMFLFLKSLSPLKNMLIVLFFSVTLLIILSALYMALVIRKNQAIEKMQREYVDNISHELKSPIASVRALTETMYDGLVKDEEKRRKYCGIMLTELTGLEHTVSSMLELSRIQSHQADCSKTPLSTMDIFNSVIDKYTVLCDDMGLSFSCFPALESYPLLYTNQALAARLLDILLDNAVKFVGIEGSVEVSFKNEFRQMVITVKNNGTVIVPADQPYIFKRFYKSDKAHNEKGSGLGLAIASEIAVCLNEKLWLKKSNASGTEFAFTLQKK